MATLTESQNEQLSSGLNTLSADGGSLLGTASPEQLAALKSTLTQISAGLSSGITSDSTSAVNNETTIGQNIDDLSVRSGLDGNVDDFIDPLIADGEARAKEIERQRRLLEARRDREVAGIKEGFAVEKEATEFQQSRETGQTATSLARAGGFNSVAASRQGVLQNLVISQRSELRALEATKQEAIRAANNAFEDRDFEYAQELLKDARAIETEIFNRKNVFFNQQLDLASEERSQLQESRDSSNFERDNANDQLDRILEAGITPEPEDVFAIAEGLGITTDAANEIIKAGAEAKTLEEKDNKTDRELAIINTLRGIPRDQTVVIDGVTYRGLDELSSSSGGTATERAKAEQDSLKAGLMEDIIGATNPDTGEIETINIQDAIKLYPGLTTSYIEGVFSALEEADNREATQQKITNGEWDVVTVDGETVVYDKEQYKQAIKTWSENTDDGFFGVGEIKGDDDLVVRVNIDGVEYAGKGTADSKGNLFAPFFPEDFQITNF